MLVVGYGAAVEEREDVGVLEAGGGADFGEESLGAYDGAQFRAQELDGNEAVVLQVAGEVDGGHATAAQLPLDAVAVNEGDLK